MRRTRIESFKTWRGGFTYLIIRKGLYTEHGEEMMRMTGNEIYHGYFDQANANIRTAMEHKSGDREQEYDSMERRNQPEAGEPPAQGHGRDEGNLYQEAEKTKTVKEIKQPAKGR